MNNNGKENWKNGKILALILKNHNQVGKIEYLLKKIKKKVLDYSNNATPNPSLSKTYLFAEISAGFHLISCCYEIRINPFAYLVLLLYKLLFTDHTH